MDREKPFHVENGFITFTNGKVALQDIMAIDTRNDPSISSIFFFIVATFMGMASESFILMVVGLLNGFAFLVSLASYSLILKTTGGDIKVASGTKEDMETFKEEILTLIKVDTGVNKREHEQVLTRSKAGDNI